MRRKNIRYAEDHSELKRKIAKERNAFNKRVARIKRQDKTRKAQRVAAIQRFKPKAGQKGTIVFIGLDGKPSARYSDRKGYAIYVNKNGKKSVVRQVNRKLKKVERNPPARKLRSIDVSEVRSKKARLNFWRAYTNEIVSGKLANLESAKKVPNGTRHSGKLKTDRIDYRSSAVKSLAKELAQATNTTRSKKDFLVTIGIHIRDKQGKLHFVTTQQRFSRLENQKATAAECEKFFGYVIYGFLANELATRDLVLSGSARHVSRRKENKGEPREYWTKDGFLWQGHDMQDVTITNVEYRFDQLTLGK